jgi:hypothetical protein
MGSPLSAFIQSNESHLKQLGIPGTASSANPLSPTMRSAALLVSLEHEGERPRMLSVAPVSTDNASCTLPALCDRVRSSGAGGISGLQQRAAGYAIRYPASLLTPVSRSDAGAAFAATSGSAGFRVFGVPLAGRSPRQLANEAQRICPGARPDYRVVKPTLVAVSCETGDHIIYQKSLLRGGLQITVRGEYPTRERARWDPVVTSIARSMSVSSSQ